MKMQKQLRSLVFLCLQPPLPSWHTCRTAQPANASLVPALQRLSGHRMICSYWDYTIRYGEHRRQRSPSDSLKREAGLSVEEERVSYLHLAVFFPVSQHTDADCASHLVSRRRSPRHVRNDSAKRALGVNSNQAVAEEEKQPSCVSGCCVILLSDLEVSVFVVIRTRTRQSDCEGVCSAAECNQR